MSVVIHEAFTFLSYSSDMYTASLWGVNDSVPLSLYDSENFRAILLCLSTLSSPFLSKFAGLQKKPRWHDKQSSVESSCSNRMLFGFFVSVFWFSFALFLFWLLFCFFLPLPDSIPIPYSWVSWSRILLLSKKFFFLPKHEKGPQEYFCF